MQSVTLTGTYKKETLYVEMLTACPWLNPTEIGAYPAYFEISDAELKVFYDERFAPADSDALIQAVFAAHNPANLSDFENEEQDRSKRIQQIKNYLASITGMNFADLTTADRWKLLAVILMQFRVLDANGVVQSYEEWRI